MDVLLGLLGSGLGVEALDNVCIFIPADLKGLD